MILAQIRTNVLDPKQSDDGELVLEWLQIVQDSASITLFQYL